MIEYQPANLTPPNSLGYVMVVSFAQKDVTMPRDTRVGEWSCSNPLAASDMICSSQPGNIMAAEKSSPDLTAVIPPSITDRADQAGQADLTMSSDTRLGYIRSSEKPSLDLTPFTPPSIADQADRKGVRDPSRDPLCPSKCVTMSSDTRLGYIRSAERSSLELAPFTPPSITDWAGQADQADQADRKGVRHLSRDPHYQSPCVTRPSDTHLQSPYVAMPNDNKAGNWSCSTQTSTEQSSPPRLNPNADEFIPFTSTLSASNIFDRQSVLPVLQDTNSLNKLPPFTPPSNADQADRKGVIDLRPFSPPSITDWAGQADQADRKGVRHLSRDPHYQSPYVTRPSDTHLQSPYVAMPNDNKAGYWSCSTQTSTEQSSPPAQ